MKLTPAQKEFLQLLAEAGEDGRNVYDGYRPAMKLVELGLAKKTYSRFGSTRCTITDLGKEMMEKINE